MPITVVVSIIALAFSVFFGFFSLFFSLKNNIKENTRINMKLDAISNNTTDIKNEVSEMRKEINSHDSRIIKVEESVKSYHHRLDGIEERLNAMGKE